MLFRSEASYRIDDSSSQPLSSSNDGYSFNLPMDLPTGRHELEISVRDSRGNRGQAERSFLILRDRPSLHRMSEPVTKDDTYNLMARIDPASYPGKYTARCFLDGREVLADIDDDMLLCQLDLRGLEDGEHRPRIQLRPDYDKNYELNLTFTKDTQSPNIIINMEDSYQAGGVQILIEKIGRASCRERV